MIALYTETFQEFIENNNDNPAWVALVTKLSTHFPSFEVAGDSLGIFDILYRKYCFREIGRETEELFFNSFDKKVDEVLIKYTDKVSAYLANASDLMSFKVDLTDTEKLSNYLNPSTASLENLNVDEVTKRDRSYTRFIAPMTSRPDLMKKVQGLESIYYKAVEEFESCFMGCF